MPTWKLPVTSTILLVCAVCYSDQKPLFPVIEDIIAYIGETAMLKWRLSDDEFTYKRIQIARDRPDGRVGYQLVKLPHSATFCPDGNCTLRVIDLYPRYHVHFQGNELTLEVADVRQSDSGNYIVRVSMGEGAKPVSSVIRFTVKIPEGDAYFIWLITLLISLAVFAFLGVILCIIVFVGRYYGIDIRQKITRYVCCIQPPEDVNQADLPDLLGGNEEAGMTPTLLRAGRRSGSLRGTTSRPHTIS